MQLFLDSKPVPYGTPLPLDEVESLQYTWSDNLEPQTYYALVIYDLDSDNPPTVYNLTVDIQGDKIKTGRKLISRQLDSKSFSDRDNRLHRVIVSLYGSPKPTKDTRTDNLVNFLARNNLYPITREVLLIHGMSESFQRGFPSDYLRNLDHPLIRGDSPLSDQQQRACSCVVHVSENSKADNPYAICNKSVGGLPTECMAYYNFHEFTDSELQSLAKLNKTAIPEPYDRTQLIQRLSNK